MTYAPGRRDKSIHSYRYLPSPNARLDTLYGGRYQVAGTVAVAGIPDVPVARKVRLLHLASGRIAREVWSDLAGNYSFSYVAAGPWTVLAHDYTGEYNAVVADNILGVPL